MQGKLNIFQRSMLQWDEFHPYNAVHVVRFPGSFERARLQGALEGVLQRRGLTGLTLDPRRGTYHYRGGPEACPIQTLAGVGGAADLVRDEVERQLNLPFPRGGGLVPFRPFAALEPEGFSFGLAYFHAVADAESVMLLLREIAETYLGEPGAGAERPFPEDPERAGGGPGLLRFARRAAAWPAQAGNLRRSFRPPCREPRDLRNRLRLFSVGGETWQAAVRACRQWSVTFNDLFLALLLRALSPVAAARRQAPRRRSLSVGVIVNLRRHLPPAAGPDFGLRLGSFVVTHEVPEGLSLRDLAADVSRQTRRAKRDRLYQATPAKLALVRLLMSFFPAERRPGLIQKHHPLWGGITNMNLNSVWNQSERPQPIDYFRAVSTGPVSPLVLSLTTVGEHTNISLTYRPAVFSEQALARVQEDLLDMLRSLEAAA